MTEQDVADHVAAQFVPEFGTAIQYEVKREWNNPSPPPQATRGVFSSAAELAVITYAASSLERYGGGDSIDAMGHLSDYAINVRGHSPDAVQAAIVRGIGRPIG